MSQNQTRPNRILAIDPTTKGFGYAILDLPKHLVAWGMAHVKGEKSTGAIFRFEALLDQFRPDAVVLEDTTAKGSRRYPRVRELLDTLGKIARERGIPVQTVSRLAVIAHFSKDETAIKHSIATTLAVAYPELAEKVPRKRKIYQSEDERIAVYDALSLAVTFAGK